MSGFTTVILVMLILCGLILISLGVISIYVASIYDEQKARPLFVVRKPRPEEGEPMTQIGTETERDADPTAASGG